MLEEIKDAWVSIQDLLKIELVQLQGGALTPGNILLALAVFTAGIFVSRKLSRLLMKRAFQRVLSDDSKALTLQTLTHYILLTIFLLISLQTANIPLTIFTVAGGALAIGIGFGTQNLLNNFISGIILLFERPIKLGDFVEINGEFGEVQKIGFRSTQILAYGNKHFIFPNSFFLEKEFVNWTLLDSLVRDRVRVGVAYGSDTPLVKKLLEKAVDSHSSVLKKPAPKVLFSDFGDSALIFDVYYTIVNKDLTDRKSISSELRFKIDDLFRENKVTIAFPQLDVHFDSSDIERLSSSRQTSN